MLTRPLHVALLALAGTLSVLAAPSRVKVTVSRAQDLARPAETVSVPFAEVGRQLPGLRLDHVLVRSADGSPIPYQVTNYHPDQRPAVYDEILFQVAFPAGSKSADFTIEDSAEPVPPFPSRVFARHVPERLDDFAFENDRLAHRIYGRALSTPAAGKSLLVGSGIDVWTKRVPYLIVDRWYLKGHDAYHVDSGEGLDFYSVNNSRGCGGTGVWNGSQLLVSANWTASRVIANGPLRAIFELDYAAWDAGNANYIMETKRFTVDAGSNLHRVDSSFKVVGKAPSLTIGIGIAKHATASMTEASAPDASWFASWESYKQEGQMGCAIVLSPKAPRKGLAEDPLNKLVLTETKPADTVSYYVGACWTGSGQFSGLPEWKAYVSDFARRLEDPLSVSVTPVP